jgi:hypothetical protein
MKYVVLALSGHANRALKCPLLGVKQTYRTECKGKLMKA